MSPPTEGGRSARIGVRVTPRSGRDEVSGVRDGLLVMRVAAPPVEGAANAAVVTLIAEALDVAPSRVHVVRGATARRKVVAVDGLDPAAIRARWPELGV